MSDDVLMVEDGEVRRCPACHKVYAFENETKILYRNTSLVFRNKQSNATIVKCRNCKHLIEC